MCGAWVCSCLHAYVHSCMHVCVHVSASAHCGQERATDPQALELQMCVLRTDLSMSSVCAAYAPNPQTSLQPSVIMFNDSHPGMYVLIGICSAVFTSFNDMEHFLTHVPTI